MSDGSFWKVYLVLLHPRLGKQDAELLSTPQIVDAGVAEPKYGRACVSPVCTMEAKATDSSREELQNRNTAEPVSVLSASALTMEAKATD